MQHFSRALPAAFEPATTSSVLITLQSLLRGTYAVAALHGQSMDGELTLRDHPPTAGCSPVAIGPLRFECTSAILRHEKGQ